MRRLLPILVLLIASPCWGRFPVPIQAAKGTGTAAFANNVTSGNVIYCISGWITSTSTPSVSDLLGTSYSQIYLDTALTRRISAYIGTAPSSGANTVTFSVTSASQQTLGCMEFNFNGYSTTADATNTGQAAAPLTKSVTTSANGDLILTQCSGGNVSILTSDALDNPLLFASNVDRLWGAFRYAGTNGAYSPGCKTGSGTPTISVGVAAFKTSSIAIDTSALPDGIQGDAYSYSLLADGGSGAYTWSITAGSLPLGLSLNTSTGAITGTPTHSNPNTITFQVSDGSTSATADLTLTVKASANTIAQIKNSSAAGLFTGGSTAGDIIVVPVVVINSDIVYPKCTDTLGTPYVFHFSRHNYSGGNQPQSIMYEAGIVPSTGANTVSCLTGVAGVGATEFSNVQNFADNIVFNSAISGTSLTSSSITPEASNSLVLGNVIWQNNATNHADTAPCTEQWGNNGVGTGCYFISTTITGYTANVTTTSSITSGVFVISSIRPTGTGTAPLPPSGYPVIY